MPEQQNKNTRGDITWEQTYPDEDLRQQIQLTADYIRDKVRIDWEKQKRIHNSYYLKYLG